MTAVACELVVEYSSLTRKPSLPTELDVLVRNVEIIKSLTTLLFRNDKKNGKTLFTLGAPMFYFWNQYVWK